MNLLDFLEEVEIFKDLDDGQLTAVQECCGTADYRRNDKLFCSRQEAESLWAVIDGTVELRKERKDLAPPREDSIASLTSGMTFGWPSIVPPFKYSLSAYCSSRSCKVLKVEKTCLKRLFETDSSLAYRVMSHIVSVVGTRFHQLREDMIKNIGYDIINRW